MFIDPTKEEIYKENLKKLSTHLHSLPSDYEQFEMATFFDAWQAIEEKGKVQADIEIEYNTSGVLECGTIACAVGHGPAAGVKVPHHIFSERFGVSDWNRYSEEVFGLDCESAEWDWLFSGDWTDFDNTPQGAAKRIDLFLEHTDIDWGKLVPEDEDLWDWTGDYLEVVKKAIAEMKKEE